MELNSLFTDDYNRLQTIPKKGALLVMYLFL